MKRILNVVLLLCASSLLLVGCSNKVSEKDVCEDLTHYSYEAVFEDDETVSDATIVYETEDEITGKKHITCIVTTEDKARQYKKEMYLTYTRNEDKDWVLEDVETSDEKMWDISPIAGVSQDEILSSLQYSSVTTGDEVWTIYAEDASVTIDKQTTDLENGTDTIVVTLEIDDAVQKAVGQLELQYDFNNEWELVSQSVVTEFAASVKPGLELNATDTFLKNALDKQTVSFGVKDIQTQTVIINKKDLSNFKVKKHESTEKGAVVTYYCTGTLTKKHVVLDLDLEMVYQYTDSWQLSTVNVQTKCKSVDIVGTWSGSNVYGRTCVLKITSVDKDGNVKGTYTDKGDKYHNPYSYNISGKLDMATLRFTLDAGSLLSAKPYSAFRAEDITALLKIDNCTITGNADLKFTVALK